MKEIYCKWGTSTGAALVPDVDCPILRERSWQITESNASGKPYARTTIGRKTVYMHRTVVQCSPTYKVGHKDGNGLNNQRPNLRVAGHEQNNLNRGGWSFSGYKGVSLDGRGFRARISVNSVQKTLGWYATALEAALAYDDMAHGVFGEFAWFNFPENYPQREEIEIVPLPF